ncbi:MFS transporter [Candidatus Bipolaricaulota bacterium]|nr:MFS transporter [Candidatus Bipolaricaulota bacterium]
MPHISFASNLLWVMVIGLLGPSVPAIVHDLGISYTQAGFLFTLLSLGSLFGSSLGAIASDYMNRKRILAAFCGLFAGGLISMGFVPGYVALGVTVFIVSLFGSPIGAIGQSVMLDMFHEQRPRLMSVQTLFAAVGSFIAPLLVSLNISGGIPWRGPFLETAGLVLLLMVIVLMTNIPNSSADRRTRVPLTSIMRNPSIIIASALVFLTVAVDLGFSYWLAEYFNTELGVSMGLASATVSLYLVGVIAGRLATSRLVKWMPTKRILVAGLLVASLSLVGFLFIQSVGAKAALTCVYGLGVAPVFPLLVAKASEEYPQQSGAVTGLLFGCMSLGGMVFPLLLGVLASAFGIRQSYFLSLSVLVLILLVILVWIRTRKTPGTRANISS